MSSREVAQDDGSAVVLAMVVVLLLAALAFATATTTDIEKMSASGEPNRLAVVYAADAALEHQTHGLEHAGAGAHHGRIDRHHIMDFHGVLTRSRP